MTNEDERDEHEERFNRQTLRDEAEQTCSVCGIPFSRTYVPHNRCHELERAEALRLEAMEDGITYEEDADEEDEHERSADGTERTYKVPPTFYADHCARDLPSGILVSKTKRQCLVRLTADEYAELLSDATYYANEGTRAFGNEYLGLVRSAEATVRALRRQAELYETSAEFAGYALRQAERTNAGTS